MTTALTRTGRRFTCLTSLLLFANAAGGPLSVTPVNAQVQPGSLVILSASEWVNWSASAGRLGSREGDRVVLEVPNVASSVTVTVTDPKDPSRKAFALLTIQAPATLANAWPDRKIAAGDNFSLAVTADGRVWMWGKNDAGQLPGVTDKTVPLPRMLDGLSGVRAVDTNRDRTTYDHTVWAFALDGAGIAWGWNPQAGPEQYARDVVNISAEQCPVIQNRAGEVLFTPRGAQSKMQVANVAFATGLSNTNQTVVALDQAGRVLVASGCEGRTFTAVKNTQNVVQLAPISGSVVLTLDQRGAVSLLNTETGSSRLVAGFKDITLLAGNVLSPLKGVPAWGFALTRSGEVVTYQADYRGLIGTPRLIPDFRDITDVSVSRTHALFLRKDGAVFALGNNAYGQLGSGLKSDALHKPVQVIGLTLK